jgi:prepilin-type N-terminal cleavage/methylation domain-containing protein
MKLNATSRRRSAFTLVEVLLALGIFTILIAALYSTWILVVRATIVGKKAAAQLQRERITMRTIEDSLTCIQSHQASINYYLFDIQNGDQPLLSFTALVPDTFPRSGEFKEPTPDGVPMDYSLRRLTFSLQQDQDQNGGKDLVLRQNPVLMDLSPSEMNMPLVLAKNVSDFLVECWNTNTAEWDTEWDATNMLPPLVRVTVAFGDKNSGSGQVLTRMISFPASTMPTAVQTPSGGNFQGGQGFFNNNQGNSGTTPFNPYTPGSGQMSPQTLYMSKGPPNALSLPGSPPDLGTPQLPANPSQLPR